MGLGKKYKVLSKSLTGLGKALFKKGDEVYESYFAAGIAHKLSDSGILESTEVAKKKTEKVKHTPKETKKSSNSK